MSPRFTKTGRRFLAFSGIMALAIAGLAVTPSSRITLAQGSGSSAGPTSSGGPGPGRGPMWSGRDMWMPGWMHRRMWRRGPADRSWRGNMSSRMQRHWTFMHGDIPRQYRGARSTIEVNAANIAAGGTLYQTHCAACHGKTGLGDGEAGKALSPSPALLAYMIQRPMAVDEFLLWSISEGGKQFKTDMPTYKDVLKPNDIWQIVAWMRAGFPTVKAK